VMASPFRQASFQPIPGVAPHEWGVPVDVSARVFPITASDPIQERRVLSAAFHAGVQDRIASLRARREPHRYTVFPFSNIVIGRIIPPQKKVLVKRIRALFSLSGLCCKLSSIQLSHLGLTGGWMLVWRKEPVFRPHGLPFARMNSRMVRALSVPHPPWM